MALFEDLHWTAGFLEGEGCFYSRLSTICISAAQVEFSPLAKLKSLFGGTIYKYAAKKPNHSDYYVWRLSGPKAAGLVMTLYALMSPKRKAKIVEIINRWKIRAGKYAVHCKHGHPFTEDNIYYNYHKTGRVNRECRSCRNWANSKFLERKRTSHSLKT